MPTISLVAVIPRERRANEPAFIAAYTYLDLIEIPGAGTQLWLKNLGRYVTIRDIAVVNARFVHKDKLVEVEFEVNRKELDWLIVGGWRIE